MTLVPAWMSLTKKTQPHSQVKFSRAKVAPSYGRPPTSDGRSKFSDRALRFHYFISSSRTVRPPSFLLTSAASMKARTSIDSSGETGGTPVWKNFTISTTRFL